jgi:quercetin dioxygenase-like cupin family protein
MRRWVGVVVMTLVVGILPGMSARTALMAQQAPVKRTMLQQKEIEGMPTSEAVLYIAEFTPGGIAGRHYHPGPELGYVLEGSVIIESDGQGPVTLKAGDSFHNPSKHVHNPRNGSATAPAKLLVVLIGEKGQPLASPVP